MQYVYHVVTEKPMSLGQRIIFDESNHNGVYSRVKTFFDIISGNESGALAEFIKSDMDKWAKVAIEKLHLKM